MKTSPFISPKQLARRYGVSRITIWNWRKKGKLPKPLIETGRETFWLLVEIEEFDRRMKALVGDEWPPKGAYPK
ncbi:MAG: AlpA family phage regulatory protein [Planctomycetaceae bacterium]|nr:AlpA family phage regulatory protein [Planctomycetaceae bacterium]